MENNNHQQPPQDNEQLKNFWSKEMEGDLDFKNHKFPITRIKRIMKFDPDVNMIAAEALILFSKACEMFIMDLTMRSWLHAQEIKRLTIQRFYIAAAVARTVIFDFLLDEELRFVAVSELGPRRLVRRRMQMGKMEETAEINMWIGC
ncbi:Transcription factor CBF/NF-Y/archaeal histone domain [Arabidopsis suecica]|uniref:Transcription factor CBF/NF-Y/archaeal histone domain n=1 Tax=Arabidopsis suecica TaxID=45249 RepID=A0A8T2BB90_ARASU|nr:Transcription factor CBF/NF-Y/archaeal histone domain [Arabidopsis suecica]